jgi:hypothetical protein
MCFNLNKIDVNFDKLSSCTHHVHIHGKEKNFQIKCGIACCNDYSTNEITLRLHISRNHGLHVKNGDNLNTTSLNRNIRCQYCLEFTTNDFMKFRSYFYKHFNDYDTGSCVYKDCSYSSKSLSNYQTHQSRVHRLATLDHVKEELFYINEQDIFNETLI